MDKHSKRKGQAEKHTAGISKIPSRMMMEQTLRDIHRALQGQNFHSIEQANTFLAKLAGPGLGKALQDAPQLSAQDEAQELAYSAMEASTRGEAIALARQAIAKDPDCVDALTILATAEAKSADDLIAGMEKAVAAGERSLGAGFFEENKGHFWGILETRPYMRARQHLAEYLHDAGRLSEAIHHYEAMLTLNPNDNQGVRDLLLGCYLEKNDLNGAQRLSHKYKSDAGAVFGWGRALERFLSGDGQEAERALKHARTGNRFVELYLTGRKKIPPKMPDYYSFGSQEEALICVDIIGAAWAAHPEALAWLRSSAA